MLFHDKQAPNGPARGKVPLALPPDLGREFLRETPAQIRVADGGEREICCPICKTTLRKLTPQHFRKHGLGLQESYRKFPQLGFNRCARVIIQLSAPGLLSTGKVFGLTIARHGVERSIL
jgi:hypothetical protein